jgi:hypothetical protein
MQEASDRAMDLRSQLEQRKVPLTLTLSVVALALSTLITLVILPVAEPSHPPATMSANVFAANTESSAQSTIYIFNFKVATGSSIDSIEITAPANYDLRGAAYIGGLGFQVSTFTVSDSKMKVIFQEPIHIPAGSLVTIEVGGINNPSAIGIHTFVIATIDSFGSVVDSGSASITITEPTILQSSIGDEHIQDGAVTTTKIADGAVDLNKMAAGVFFFLDDRFSALLEQITAQINNLEAELKGSISSEESERVAADSEESSARAAEDENLREEIDDLREQIAKLEAEIETIANSIS